MARSSINIQYQSTGVGSLPSLSKIDQRGSIHTRLIYKFLWHFLIDVLVKHIFLEISIKVRGAVTSKIIMNKNMKNALVINTVSAYVPIGPRCDTNQYMVPM